MTASRHHPLIYLYIKMTVTFPIVFSLWIHPGNQYGRLIKIKDYMKISEDVF